MGNKKNKKRSRPRFFCGNQHTSKRAKLYDDDDEVVPTLVASSSTHTTTTTEQDKMDDSVPAGSQHDTSTSSKKLSDSVLNSTEIDIDQNSSNFFYLDKLFYTSKCFADGWCLFAMWYERH